jgi:hypothetical protein
MMKRKFFFYFFLLISILFSIQPVFAGSNALTRFEYDETAGTGFFDLVVSLDWEPTSEEIDGTLQTAFQQFACDIFTMTEGHHKVRNIYVYTDGQQMNTADIRISNEVGRSSAYVNGIFQKGARILAYTLYEDQTPRTGEFLGHTLAHEFAHYAYGLFDEYADAASDPNAPLSQPWFDDMTKETIMANQGQWQWFSTSWNYSDEYCKDAAQCRNTAQWRVYQSSAWETLVRHPNNDPTQEEWKAVYNRPFYDDFIQMEEEPLELTMPTEGCTSDLNVIYKQGNVAVLVIDRSGSMRQGAPPLPIDLAKSAAQLFVDQMNVGDRVAVVDFSSDAATTIGITELTDVGARTTVKDGIAGLIAGGQTNFFAALNQALTVLLEGSSPEETRYVVMLSDGAYTESYGPPNLEPYIENEIPIYTIGLNVEDRGANQLQNIADTTGATYRAAPNAQELADLYAEINRDIQGTSVAIANQNDQLVAGGENVMETVVSDRDHVVTFRASWEPGDNMEFVVTDPNGTEYTPQDPSYTAGSGYGLYTFNNPTPGVWTSRLRANTVNAGGQISQEASADSPLAVQLDLAGGDYPEPVSIMATVTAPEPVVGAEVTATVTRLDDPTQTILEEFPLQDDGQTPDLIPNDGVYSGVYPNYDADGDYTVTVDVNNSSQTATLDTSGALEPGEDAAPVPLSDFRRHIQGNVTVSGYVAPSSDPADADETESDNSKNWGVIDNTGAVRWYQFTAEADQQYFISTSNLLSWDDESLATRLTLYEADAVTEIDSKAGYQDSDVSMIKWIAEESGTYYVAVSTESGGTGNFALTIGTVDIVTPTIEANNETNSGDGRDNGDDSESSSGGCFIDTVVRFSR